MSDWESIAHSMQDKVKELETKLDKLTRDYVKSIPVEGGVLHIYFTPKEDE